MPSIQESLAAKSQLAAVLAAGVTQISSGQAITFTKYVKLTLPLDGTVFWVRSDLVAAEALLNMTQVGPNPVSGEATFSASGSLHFATRRLQTEDETIGVNKVIFTAAQEVQPFNEISPVVMFFGAFDGVRFAFGERRSYYKQADLHHYMGDAIYPAMLSQIIDSVDAINLTNLVVSNSLPVWLSLASYSQPWLPAPNPCIALYPSFLVPDNLSPPYGVVHIESGQTEAIQSTASIGPVHNHCQLVKDRVRITFYGATNDQATAFLDLVNQYSLDTDCIGLMNMPVIRDEKRIQTELGAIAMKKTVSFEVNYHQASVREIAQQLILSVVNQYFPTITTVN